MLGIRPSRSIMYGLGISLALVLASVNVTNAPAGTEHRAAIAWKEVWSDSFAGAEGSRVSPAYWKYDTGTGVFGTGEVETMTASPANVRLNGLGDLIIEAARAGGSWTSGRIQSRLDFAAPSGGEMMVSASIRLPDPSAGLGYWPAFWLLSPGTWPQDGEIDIMEDVNALGLHSGTLHCGNLTQKNSDGTTGPCHEPIGITSGLQACPGCKTSYSTYSLVIDRRHRGDEQIRWYRNGQQFFSAGEQQVGAKAWVPAVDHGFSVVFDLAIGGEYPDSVCNCTAPDSRTASGGEMIIRNVAVYDSA
jgi:beta-glucanase (GH16 family)